MEIKKKRNRKPHSEETKKKMSISHIGVPKSELHKQHMSEAHKNVVINEEWRNNMTFGLQEYHKNRRMAFQKIDELLNTLIKLVNDDNKPIVTQIGYYVGLCHRR